MGAGDGIPSGFVYGGTIKPGHLEGEDPPLVSTFDAVSEFRTGSLTKSI